jgi:hypothetical protein
MLNQLYVLIFIECHRLRIYKEREQNNLRLSFQLNILLKLCQINYIFVYLCQMKICQTNYML